MSTSQNRVSADGPAPIRVIVAHPQAAVRAAVGEALAGEPGIVVSGVAATAVAAIELVRRHRPAIVLVDIESPAPGTTSALVELSTVAAWMTVAIAAADDDEQAAVAALRRGAAGIVPADLSGLAQALRSVAAGGAAIAPALAMGLVRELRVAHGAGLRVPRSLLTPREWDLLDVLCESASARQVAAPLQLTEATVHGQARRILRKLGVRTPGAAVGAASALRSPVAG
jgi:DNA-binding NarL/FixJ family response regulator